MWLRGQRTNLSQNKFRSYPERPVKAEILSLLQIADKIKFKPVGKCWIFVIEDGSLLLFVVCWVSLSNSG